VHLALLGPGGRVLEERHGVAARTAVGLDDDVDDVVERVRFRARITTGGPVELGVLGVGDWHVEAPGYAADHVLRVSGAHHAEEILAPPAATGRADLSDGALVEATVTVPDGGVRQGTGTGYMLGLLARPAPRDDVQAVLDEAAAAAAAADVAVVVVGLTEEEETEAVDKTTLRLPGQQDALVSAVAAAASRTVVVVNAGTPVLMPWADDVDAVLVAGLPGQEGGHAVAAALLGDQEPSGRLVTSFPVADGAAPAWSVTPVDGRLVYEEGTAIGYRGHDAGLAPAPAFWFGHGLGYTTWEYTGARLVDGGDAVTVTVVNTGSRPGREVVQLYWRPGSDGQPVRLVGWAAATAEPGESVQVTVTADSRLRRRWASERGGWSPLPWDGALQLARGLGDVRATLELPGG
jgi:beta-glucosidase